MKLATVLAIIQLAFICLVVGRKKGRILTFKYAAVEFDRRYLQEHTITIGKKSDSLDIVLNIAEDMTDDVWTGVTIAIKQPHQMTYRNIFMYDLNVCKVLGRGQLAEKFNIMRSWMNNFWKYGTMPKSCPFLKGNYSWNGLRVDKRSLPGFLNDGLYRGNVTTYFKRETTKHWLESIANVSVLFSIN